MSRDLLTVAAESPLVSAVKEMNVRRVGAVIVLDDDRLVGVFTERDVLRAVAQGLAPEATVGDWMTRGPETIEPDQSAEHAAVLMIHGGFRHLPVVAGGVVVGDPLDPRPDARRARRRCAARCLEAAVTATLPDLVGPARVRSDDCYSLPHLVVAPTAMRERALERDDNPPRHPRPLRRSFSFLELISRERFRHR